MKKKWKENTKKVLGNMAEDMVESTICLLMWGEPEVPECLKRELEKTNENME